MRMRLGSFIVLAATLFSLQAFALDLHQARSTGLIGEKNDGYVSALQSTPDVNALVSDVNAKRQQEYAKIAQQQGQPVEVVAKLAAQQIVSTIEPGSMYQAADGSWKKR